MNAFNLNNEGWGLREMVTLVLIISIALIVSVTLIIIYFTGPNNKLNKGKPEPARLSYKEMESRMETASRKYVLSNYGNLSIGDKVVVKLELMQEQNFIGLLYDFEDSKLLCTGYVNYDVSNNGELVKSYLKCGDNYKTTGYTE